MEVPYFTKNAIRLIFITAENQDEEDPLSMSSLAEEAEVDLVVIQRGKRHLIENRIYNQLFNEDKSGDSGSPIHLTLTEEGEEVYSHLKNIQNVISDAD